MRPFLVVVFTLIGMGFCAPTLAQDNHSFQLAPFLDSGSGAGGVEMDLYGFARIDAVVDDSETNDNQVTFFIPSEDSSNGGRNDDGSFTLYTRLTRIGFNIAGEDTEFFGGGKVRAKIEVDFYGTGSDRSNHFRMRHVYFEVVGENCSLLVGQTSDMASPLYPSVNYDLIHWNIGNTGDRRPQLRYTHRFSDSFLLQGALALQGAVDGANNTADGVLDGEDSGIPQIQVRGQYKCNLGEARATLGAWYVRGEEEFDGVAGEDDFVMDLAGVDFKVKLTDHLEIQGEAFMGQNLDDFRGGIGQGINTTLSREIESRGFWTELGYKMNSGKIVLGYSEDNPDNSDLSINTTSLTASRTRNQVAWLGWVLKKYDPITVGFEYSHWQTEYNGGRTSGINNKYRFFFQYNF